VLAVLALMVLDTLLADDAPEWAHDVVVRQMANMQRSCAGESR
jgi:hypothetical protein